VPLTISSRNARFQQWQALLGNRSKRQRAGEFIVQGVRPITMALAGGWPVRALLFDADRPLSAWARSILGDSPAPQFALEGSVLVGGAAVQWLRDGLGLVASAAETEALARSVDSSDGVVFVPALTGLGSPWWDADARGLISGLTRGTTRAHLVRARRRPGTQSPRASRERDVHASCRGSGR
jgi:hypothetical protein